MSQRSGAPVANASEKRAARLLDSHGMAFDPWMMGIIAALLMIGLIMVGSASMHISERDFLQPWHYITRQALFIGVGLCAAFLVLRLPLVFWQRTGPFLLIGGLVMLLLVLVPGIGRTVNGATRWIDLGAFNLQVSELIKLFVIIYVAGYLVRRGEEVRTTFGGFIKPMIIFIPLAGLLLAQPDFGATVVILATAMGMMFIGGVKLRFFAALVALVSSAMAMLAITSPYRMERLTTFINPWEDPFNSGFQLTQALIAIGRGELFGVGLGAGVQKLFYLPEAHTDFIFAVMAEEFGLMGSIIVIGLFVALIVRTFQIARRAEMAGNAFAAYLAFGIGLWIGMQALINIGVNMGVLPTKGLTLPLLSYGGSSIIMTCVALALVLRVDYEVLRRSRHAERRVGKPDTRRVKRERRAVEPAVQGVAA